MGPPNRLVLLSVLQDPPGTHGLATGALYISDFLMAHLIAQERKRCTPQTASRVLPHLQTRDRFSGDGTALPPWPGPEWPRVS